MNSNTKHEAYFMDMETTDLCQEYYSAKHEEEKPLQAIVSFLPPTCGNKSYCAGSDEIINW